MRIILFTGKGGVGKTTISAATAMQTARAGLRTLVLSTDPAHSLSDALDVELGPEAQEIAPNLFAQELDIYYSMKKHWAHVRELMQLAFKWQGAGNVAAEELSALPGMEEASAFLWLEEYHRQQAYEVIIIDSAPTGETLGMLSLPQVTHSWLMKAFPLQRFAMKGFGTFMRTTTGIPLDKGMEELEQLFEKLGRIQKVMADPEVSSIRIVVNPERMVIKEAKRAYTYLQLYGYHVDAVVINRIFPEAAGDLGVFASYVQSQKQYLEEIEESFQPLPILRVPHQGQEVFGLPLLQKMGQQLYNQLAPADILFHDDPIKFKEQPDGYRLQMKLPFIREKDFELKKFGDELVITLDNQRRSVFLPRFANYLKLKDYRFDAPWLEVELLK